MRVHAALNSMFSGFRCTTQVLKTRALGIRVFKVLRCLPRGWSSARAHKPGRAYTPAASAPLRMSVPESGPAPASPAQRAEESSVPMTVWDMTYASRPMPRRAAGVGCRRGRQTRAETPCGASLGRIASAQPPWAPDPLLAPPPLSLPLPPPWLPLHTAFEAGDGGDVATEPSRWASVPADGRCDEQRPPRQDEGRRPQIDIDQEIARNDAGMWFRRTVRS